MALDEKIQPINLESNLELAINELKFDAAHRLLNENWEVVSKSSWLLNIFYGLTSLEAAIYVLTFNEIYIGKNENLALRVKLVSLFKHFYLLIRLHNKPSDRLSLLHELNYSLVEIIKHATGEQAEHEIVERLRVACSYSQKLQRSESTSQLAFDERHRDLLSQDAFAQYDTQSSASSRTMMSIRDCPEWPMKQEPLLLELAENNITIDAVNFKSKISTQLNTVVLQASRNYQSWLNEKLSGGKTSFGLFHRHGGQGRNNAASLAEHVEQHITQNDLGAALHALQKAMQQSGTGQHSLTQFLRKELAGHRELAVLLLGERVADMKLDNDGAFSWSMRRNVRKLLIGKGFDYQNLSNTQGHSAFELQKRLIFKALGNHFMRYVHKSHGRHIFHSKPLELRRAKFLLAAMKAVMETNNMRGLVDIISQTGLGVKGFSDEINRLGETICFVNSGKLYNMLANSIIKQGKDASINFSKFTKAAEGFEAHRFVVSLKDYIRDDLKPQKQYILTQRGVSIDECIATLNTVVGNKGATLAEALPVSEMSDQWNLGFGLT